MRAIRHGNLKKHGNVAESGHAESCRGCGRASNCVPASAAGVISRGRRRSRSCAAQCRVAGQFQIIQHHARHAVQPEHLFAHRFISFLLAFQHSNREPSQTRHVLRPMTGADATAVLIEIPVQHVMHRLDAPVPAIILEQLLGIGLFGIQTRDAVCAFPPAFAAHRFCIRQSARP